MIKLIDSKTLYDDFSSELLEFLIDNEFVLDNELTIPIRDLSKIIRSQYDMTISKYEGVVIVNNINWYHFMDRSIPWMDVSRLFHIRLKTNKLYINTIFKNIPNTIFSIGDIEDGELQEELLSLKIDIS